MTIHVPTTDGYHILEFDSWSHFVAVKILVIMNIEYIA